VSFEQLINVVKVVKAKKILSFLIAVVFFKIATNGFALGEGGDF
jgi:hypothetical protein